MRPGLPDRSVPFYNLILRLDHWQRRDPVLPEGFRLRFYQPGDEAAWAALEYGIGDFDPQEEARAYFVQTYGSHAQDLARRCLFAVDGGGRVAGTCSAWRDPRGGGEVASLHWLAVSPEAQGRGLGKALCREALFRVPFAYPLPALPARFHSPAPLRQMAVMIYTLLSLTKNVGRGYVYDLPKALLGGARKKRTGQNCRTAATSSGFSCHLPEVVNPRSRKHPVSRTQ